MTHGSGSLDTEWCVLQVAPARTPQRVGARPRVNLSSGLGAAVTPHRHQQAQSLARHIQAPGSATAARAPAVQVQRSIRDFFRSPQPLPLEPPTAEREAKRQRTIGSFFAAAANSPADGSAPAGPSCAVPTPAQRPEAGSGIVQRPSSSWTRPGRTAQQKPPCARRISLGEGVLALAAHRREVSVREASNEATSAGALSDAAGQASLVSAKASQLAPAGPGEHRQQRARHFAPLAPTGAAGAGQSLLRMMLMPHLQQTSLPQLTASPLAADHLLSGPEAQPSLLCHSVLGQTSLAAPTAEDAALVAQAVSRVVNVSNALLEEHDQATVQSPMDVAAAQHMQAVAHSPGPSPSLSAGPQESMGDNDASRHTFGVMSTAGEASRAQSDSQKENAQADAARRGAAAGGRPLSPGKGPRCFGTELGMRPAKSAQPPSITEESDMISSDLS